MISDASLEAPLLSSFRRDAFFKTLAVESDEGDVCDAVGRPDATFQGGMFQDPFDDVTLASVGRRAEVGETANAAELLNLQSVEMEAPCCVRRGGAHS